MIKLLVSLFHTRSQPNKTDQWRMEGLDSDNQSVSSRFSLIDRLRRGLVFREISAYASRLIRIFIVLVIVIVLVGTIAYFAFSSPPPEPSRLARVPNIDSTPLGERQQISQSYQETLRSSNINEAEEANRLGNSFISVPEGLPEQLNSKPPVKPQVAPIEDGAPQTDFEAAQLVAKAIESSARQSFNNSRSTVSIQEDGKVPLQSSPQKGDENPYHSAILRQMNAITSTLEIPGLDNVEWIAQANGADMAWPRVPISDKETPQDSTEYISTGSILRGELITLIDSDISAPVAVKLKSEPLAGDILLGNFAANHLAKSAVIEFRKLSRPGGDEIEVEAIAIDPYTRGGAVQGNVTQRPIQRYGPMLVSSFVSGFAASAQNPAMSLLNTANGIIAQSEKPSIENNLMSGLGRAADKAATDLENTSPKTPRIQIYPGTEIDILFLSSVSISIKSTE